MSGNGATRHDSGEAALYDAYLDRRLAGEALTPKAFLAEHPGAPEELRARLAALDSALDDGAPDGAPEGGAGAPPPGDGLPFERLGAFELVRPLDAGGMGMVFLARQEGLGREVAVKVVRPELRGSTTALARFRREAQAVARLRHPHIVTVFATGEDAGVLYLAMELVPGEGLDALLAREAGRGRSIEPRRAVRWGAALARALAYAHDHGIVHRDVKPANVRVTPEDEPVLLDFGVARDETAGGATLTKTFAGSPQYAAPEQLTGAGLDGRADVYGLGVLLYQALTGRVPFVGGTMETILKRVLGEEPVPPRRLNPGVPRDLDVVVLKALEKDPDRRYATAAAFADDLEAVLENRPVRARRPSATVRVGRWMRRRPGRAAVAGSVVLLLAVLAGQRAWAARERRAEAKEAVAEARRRLEGVRRRLAETEEKERRFAYLRKRMDVKHLTDGQRVELDDAEEAVRHAHREREAAYYEVLQLLRRAERLHPDVAGTDRVRAELFAERWRAARANGDRDAAAFFGGLVAGHDPGGELARAVLGPGTLRVETTPPGADVYLFRRERRPGLEPRLVPVPVGDDDPAVAPGTHALRVVVAAGPVRRTDLVVRLAGWPLRDLVLVTKGAGEVRRGDRLVSIDGKAVRGAYEVELYGGAGEPRRFVFARPGGGETVVEAESIAVLGCVVAPARAAAETGGLSARLWRDGELVDVVLPAGLEVRTTAAPLLVSPRCRAGTTPLEMELPFGRYVALVRRDGCADTRAAFRLSEERNQRRVKIPVGPFPPPLRGFVRVAMDGGRGVFWIMEREVTVAEYRVFLADPEVRRTIVEADEPVRVPRNTYLNEVYGEIGEDGSFVFDAEWRPDWAAMGVSYEDAVAYARWRTERARAAGHGVTFSVPTYEEWAFARGRGARYPFGDTYRQHWMSSCNARPRAFPEPVMRFPVDESPLGVFDMAGSAAEWIEKWRDEPRRLRELAAASWAVSRPTGLQARVDAARGDYGFRLVARVEVR